MTENTAKTKRSENEDAKHSMVSISTHYLKEFYNYQFVLIVVIFEEGGGTAVVEIMIAQSFMSFLHMALHTRHLDRRMVVN